MFDKDGMARKSCFKQVVDAHLQVCSTVPHTSVGKLLLQFLGWRLAPFSGVDVQYRCPGLQVGQREHQLTIKSGRHISYLHKEVGVPGCSVILCSSIFGHHLTLRLLVTDSSANTSCGVVKMTHFLKQ